MTDWTTYASPRVFDGVRRLTGEQAKRFRVAMTRALARIEAGTGETRSGSIPEGDESRISSKSPHKPPHTGAE